MSQHLHCPSCDHCTDWHILAQVQSSPFIPPAGPVVLQCAGCEPTGAGEHLCPAGENQGSRSVTLRLMFITKMREMVSETGI